MTALVADWGVSPTRIGGIFILYTYKYSTYSYDTN